MVFAIGFPSRTSRSRSTSWPTRPGPSGPSPAPGWLQGTPSGAPRRAPKPPEFHYYDQYPLTDNDPEVTKRITAAFRSHFTAGTVFDLGHQTASEDFSDIPNALGTPYTFWGIGGIEANKYERARAAGR